MKQPWLLFLSVGLLFSIFCEKNDPTSPALFPPSLFELVVPDTVLTGINKNELFFVKCSDQNGLNDIDTVFYKILSLTDQLIDTGVMYDDGNLAVHGDNIARDGKFSIVLKLELNQDAYRFVVQAVDRSHLQSDELSAIFYAKAGIVNHAPIISKYYIPDSIYVDQIVPFLIKVKASDPDSADYISRVTYQILGPTVAEIAEEGLLNDQGVAGDSLADDGIYAIETTTAFANWKFGLYHIIIQALDSRNQVSNSIYEILPWAKIKPGVAPEILNLAVPDTIKIPSSQEPGKYLFSINAIDADNKKDIKEVFFNSYLPNGNPAKQNPFYMYDDGDRYGLSGDLIAGDGIYSLTINIYSNALLGNYRFEFEAKDYSELLSNKIIHIITVIQ